MRPTAPYEENLPRPPGQNLSSCIRDLSGHIFYLKEFYLFLTWQEGKQNQQVLCNVLLKDEEGPKGQIKNPFGKYKTSKENYYFIISSKAMYSLFY